MAFPRARARAIVAQAALSPEGLFYLVTVEENDPAEIAAILGRSGFGHTVRPGAVPNLDRGQSGTALPAQVVCSRRAGREHLKIHRFRRGA